MAQKVFLEYTMAQKELKECIDDNEMGKTM